MTGRIMIGKTDGNEVILNPEKGNNRNVLITGLSGVGKTTFMMNYMMQLCKNGETVVAVDIHGCFDAGNIHSGLFERMKPYIHEIKAHENGITIPFFSPYRFIDGKEEGESDVLNGLVAFLKQEFVLGVKQRESLMEACKIAFRRGACKEQGFSAIAEILETMHTRESLGAADRLRPLTDYSVFYDGDFPFMKGKINIIRLSRYPEETQGFLTKMLLAYIWRWALYGYFHNNRLSVFLDEAHNLGFRKSDPVSKFLVEGRKFDISLILSTQFLPIDREVSHRLLQASLLAFFKPTEDDVLKMAKIIDPLNNGTVCYLLRTLKKGEFVVAGDMISADMIEINNHPVHRPFVVYNNIEDSFKMTKENQSRTVRISMCNPQNS